MKKRNKKVNTKGIYNNARVYCPELKMYGTVCYVAKCYYMARDV